MNSILHHFDLNRCIQRIFVEFMGFPTAGMSINFGGATKTIGLMHCGGIHLLPKSHRLIMAMFPIKQ